MRIIADAGSTKINWAIQKGLAEWFIIRTSGINPLTAPDEMIANRLANELIPAIEQQTPSEIIYYGAGCIPTVTGRMARLLSDATGCKNVTIASDMLGAARSLCGHHPGIACILGTGSNSCYYDGHDIVDSIPPLGYILGDEGSGAILGRSFINNLFKRQLPEKIRQKFEMRFGLSISDIVERVYRHPEANKFLASFVPFIKEYIREPEINKLVTDEFIHFLERNITAYPQSPVNFTGSIAVNFKKQLTQALQSCGMTLGKIEPEPITGMINFHTEQLYTNIYVNNEKNCSGSRTDND